MIVIPPVNAAGSLIICLVLSVIVAFQFRWSFASDAGQHGNSRMSFSGFYTVFISVLILITVFFQIAGLLFPGFILPLFTDTAGLHLFQMLIPFFVYYTLLFFLMPLLRKHFHPPSAQRAGHCPISSTTLKRRMLHLLKEQSY